MAGLRELNRWDGAVALALVLVVLALYGPVLGHGFLNYDDPQYVTGNPQVRAGLTAESVAWAFTHVHFGNWHPLTTLSHMADVSLYGMNARGHHATNLLLHAVNAVLLYGALRLLTGAQGLSAAAAGLFAVHPLNTEAVAWIASRKDLLSTAFGLLAVTAYGAYARKPGAARYGLVALLFAASLMSKAMLMTLPVLLLLLDYWPLGRMKGGKTVLWRRVLEKLPLLALSAVIGAVAVVAQHADKALRTLDEMPLGRRAANAAVSYAVYVLKTAWPTGLGVFYPFPAAVPWIEWTLALAGVGAVTAVVVVLAKRRPYLLTGWGWYVVALLPVIGLVQVGGHARADRYMYVPFMGLLIALVWTAGSLRWRRPAYVAGACFAALLVVLTVAQVRYWQSDETLYRRALAVTTDNARMHFNLANTLAAQGKTDEAAEHYREAVRIDPSHWKTRVNLGILYGQAGRLDEAREMLEGALAIAPDAFDAHVNLANLEALQGNHAQAVAHLEAARRTKPDDAQTLVTLGSELAQLGRLSEAEEVVTEALRLQPNNASIAQLLEAVRSALRASSG